MNRMNEILSELKTSKRLIRIRETLQSFDSLYNEINEYNTTFWSKFLFAFWLTVGSCDVLLLYITIFVPFSLFIKYVFIYSAAFFATCFLFVIFTASSVNYSVNNSYKSLNSLFITISKRNDNFSKIIALLKVCYIYKIYFSLFSSTIHT